MRIMDRIQQSVEGITFRLVSEPDEIKNKMDHIISNEISSNVENIYKDRKAKER
ncbi:hypothetical protein [Petrotoga sp. Shatin.DS.tank11.9.2.9.3]|uniref:hypothetical protein n=1 Tax=Petrotoga sp. Shatin.DS.tank11.9.2.9.3 TaxID=1469556 RepID=UPI001314E253|nr:hypothetical protein [Petrotoga sp. Shatin.DS.tank11.9.2.9.3]